MTTTADETRAKIRADLAATLRLFGRWGYQYGLAGHATVRDPGEVERYWVNPLGVPFAETTPEDIVLVNGEGEVLEGKHGAGGYQSQVAVHRFRPELRAGFHVHSFHTFAWSSKGGLLAPLNTDSAWLHGLQAERSSLGQPIEEAIGDTARILIQRSHGAVTFGETLAEAAFYFVSVERAAQTQLLLEAAGRVGEIDSATLERWGGIKPEGASRQFQVLIDVEIEAFARRRAEQAVPPAAAPSPEGVAA